MADDIVRNSPEGSPYHLPGVVTPLPEPTPENTFTAGKAPVENAPGVTKGGATDAGKPEAEQGHPAQTDTADEAAARVAKHESGGHPYIGVGGTDLKDAPIDGNGAPIWAGTQNSHAFGTFQFEPATWARYAKPLGITDWRAPGAQEEVFRAAYRNEGYAPWAPYDKPLAAEIGWRGQPVSTYADDMATHARAHGFDWDDIHAQVADASAQAQKDGATPDDVDTYLGYSTSAALKQRLADEMAVQPQGAPPSAISNGMVTDPKEAAFGVYAVPTKAAGPLTNDTALQYAKAVNQGEVKNPQEFAQVYTDQLWEAAGLTELAQEHKDKAAQDIAGQLPSMDSAVDGALYTLRDYGLPATNDLASVARANLVNLWSRTGTMPAAAAQANDPVMQGALTEEGGIRTPDQNPPDPKMTFGEAMAETGEQLAQMAQKAGKALIETARIPGQVFKGEINPEQFNEKAREFAATFGSGIAPEGTFAQGFSLLPGRTAPAVLPGTKVAATVTRKFVQTEATGLDKALHKIGQRSKATKIQLGQAVDAVEMKHRGVAFQKKVYTSVENRLVDNLHQHAPDVEAYLKQVKPLTDREHQLGTQVAAKLQATNASAAHAFALTNVNGGYVHRIRIGKEPPNSLQRQLQAGQQAVNPATGKVNPLSTYSSSMQDRVAAVWEDSAGHRFKAPDADPDTNFLFGHKATWGGQTWTLRPATSAEITAYSGKAVGAAGRTIKFHENHLANTVENIQRLERVRDNLDFLDYGLKELEKNGLWYKEAKGKAGQFQTGPQGFVKVDLPGAAGWATPKIAHVLNDFYNHEMGALETAVAKINHFLVATLFFLPVVHPLNVLNNFVVSRGWQWLNPYRYGTMVMDGARAAKEVISLGPRFIQHIREGGGFMFPNTLPEVENFHDTMIDKFTSDQTTHSHIWRDYAKAVGQGIAGFSLPKLINAQLQFSHSMTWMLNDVLLLTREFELERMGHSVADAIQKAEQDIVAYRLPSSINRVIHGLFNTPLLTMFGRYDYGQTRGLALMVKQAVVGSPLTSRTEAIGKLTVLLGVGVFGYGALNNWLAQVTDNPNAHVNSFGYSKFVHAGFEVAQGRWAAAIGSILTISPFVNVLEQLTSGLGHFGQPLINTAGTWADTAISIAEATFKNFPIGQHVINALQGASNVGQFLEQFVAQQAGLRLGPGQSQGQKLYWQARDRKTQLRQLQKDKLVQGSHQIGSWLKQHGL